MCCPEPVVAFIHVISVIPAFGRVLVRDIDLRDISLVKDTAFIASIVVSHHRHDDAGAHVPAKMEAPVVPAHVPTVDFNIAAVFRRNLNRLGVAQSLLRFSGNGVGRLCDRHYAEIDDFTAVRRTDVGKVLGVVGSRYTPLQNRDAFRILEPLLDK